MKSLEDIFLEVSKLIELRKTLSIKTSKGHYLSEAILEDIFIHDGVLKIAYTVKDLRMEMALTELESIDGRSVFDLLGLDGSDFNFFEKERLEDLGQKPLIIQNRYTVRTLTNYLKEQIESDINLMDVYLKAEVTNFSRSSQGHVYFSLKEEDVSIRCVFFKGSQLFPVQFKNGDIVEIIGNIKVYETQGTYQFVVQKLASAGEGLFYAQYQALWDEFQAKGLFDESRKKKIPPYPRKIALITSKEGAALEDILKIWKGQNYFDVIIYHSSVQGRNASKTMIENIFLANEDKEIDVLLLARGGGSLEDLWCFNDKNLAEAIIKSRIPVITAIGHEIDNSLCDYVSDLRLPTPTAAAYYLLSHYDALESTCLSLKEELRGNFTNLVREVRNQCEILKKDLLEAFSMKIRETRNYLEAQKFFLESALPSHVLSQGYVIVRGKGGKQIKRARELREEVLTLEFSDAKVKVSVLEKELNDA